MIITEFYYGQGLGNQLAVYVATRAIALRNGYEFGFIGLENIGDKRYNSQGVYFMDLDLGKEVDLNLITNHYTEKEIRIKRNHNYHDSTLGCDVRMTDMNLINIPDNTKIDFTSDDICVLNVRDYEGDPALYLTREYWINAINHMVKINPNMQFLVITENVEAAKRLLPELSDNIYHFDVGKDYATIKNSRWLILSNSSFAYFPALVNEEAKFIIAPKYWARHNVSDGYWATSMNLCKDFTYMDRDGKLQTYDECKIEFDLYKQEHSEIYNN